MRNERGVVVGEGTYVGQRMIYVPGAILKNVLKNPCIKDLYITHIGVFPKAIGQHRIRPKGCRQFILIYCLSGEGWVEVRGIRTAVNKNQLFVIEPNTACSYGANDRNPWTNYWIHFTGANASAYSPVLNQIIKIPPSNNSRLEERLILFEEMLQNLKDCFVPDKVVYANICLKQFLSSIKYLEVYRSVKKDNEHDVINEVISYMRAHLNVTISAVELAQHSNYSYANLYRLFKKNIGSSPHDYFIHLKMERAIKYLLTTNLKVKEIGLKLGYEDPYYFSRMFTNHVGLSPANYRKEAKL